MLSGSDEGPSTGTSASRFAFVVLAGLFDLVYHPVRTTIGILKRPFCFGQQIANSEKGVKDSTRYNVECLAILIGLSNLVGRRLAVHLLPEFRHSEELEGILYAFGAVATGVCGYLAVRALKDSSISLNRNVAAYNYWFGLVWLFSLVAVPLEVYKVDPQSRLGSLLALPIGFAAFFLFAVLLRWLADINNISWTRAFVSFWLGIILFNLIFRPVFFLLNLFLKRWHVFINPYSDT